MLSFDKEIVVSALKRYQVDDGNKYLEKIIQVAISISPATQSQLQNVFNIYFSTLLDNKINSPFPDMVFDREYWIEISEHIFNMVG